MIPCTADLDAIEAVMDVIDQPMFLLDVKGPNSFQFRRLNRCHEAVTGMSNAALVGHAPHEILPPRIADTVVKNYETCRASGDSYSYEENLELASGPRWWHTNLTPVPNAAGELRQIIGLATDISAQKRRQFQIEQRVAEMSQLNGDLQVFAATTAQNMRGPFQTMAALLDLVQENFIDFGDEKVEQLALCSEVAQKAIGSMTGVISAAEQLKVSDVLCEKVNLPHIASDIAAIVDPHHRIEMDLPSDWLEVDTAALQMVLRRLMENGVHYADRQMAIVVSAQAGGLVAITVADDGASMDHNVRCDGCPVLPGYGDAVRDDGLTSARAIVEARGGGLSAAPSPFGHGAAITFTLPGKVIEPPMRAKAPLSLPLPTRLEWTVGPAGPGLKWN